jgi:hypothetical protein
MAQDLRERLKEKGWTDEDINKAIKIIESAKEKKPQNIKIIDSIVYWVVLIVTIVGNLILSIILVPFLLTLSHIQLYIIIGTIAATFGFLFDLLIRDIENLEQKHYIIAGVFIPSIAIIDVYFMVRFANYLTSIMKLNNIQHNPLIVGLVYTVAFIMPYLVNKYIIQNK